jgi:hypothetical protein
MCPLDRCIRNCVLPVLGEAEGQRDAAAVDLFLQLFEPFGANPNLIVELLRGSLATVEFEDRISPGAASRDRAVLLLRNLYRTIALIHRASPIEFADLPCAIHRYLVGRLRGDADAFDQILGGLGGPDRLIFARQAAIFRAAIGAVGDVPPPGDLRTELFCARFPRNFFHFGLPRYGGYPMHRCQQSLGLCLLTDTAVDRGPPAAVKCAGIWEHAAHCGGLCVVLALTGDAASATLLVSMTFRMAVKMPTLYRDLYNAEDIALERGGLLALRDGDVRKLAAAVLSGDWVAQLKAEALIDCVPNTSETDDMSN